MNISKIFTRFLCFSIACFPFAQDVLSEKTDKNDKKSTEDYSPDDVLVSDGQGYELKESTVREIAAQRRININSPEGEEFRKRMVTDAYMSICSRYEAKERKLNKTPEYNQKMAVAEAQISQEVLFMSMMTDAKVQKDTQEMVNKILSSSASADANADKCVVYIGLKSSNTDPVQRTKEIEKAKEIASQLAKAKRLSLASLQEALKPLKDISLIPFDEFDPSKKDGVSRLSLNHLRKIFLVKKNGQFVPVDSISVNGIYELKIQGSDVEICAVVLEVRPFNGDEAISFARMNVLTKAMSDFYALVLKKYNTTKYIKKAKLAQEVNDMFTAAIEQEQKMSR